MNANVIWVLWLALFAVFEAIGVASKREGDTLSERTRDWFRTKDSRTGRRVFGAGWAAFALWFLWHILWQHPTVLAP